MMNKKNINKIALIALFSSMLISCNQNTHENENDEYATLRIFMNGGNDFEGKKKDSIWKKIEEETKVNMRIEGATHNSDYYTTLNPMINTGDIPDIIFSVPSSSGKAYNNWVEQDIIFNIDELLVEKPGEYPYIEALLNSDQYKNITYGDGAHTLIPYLTSNSGWGIYYRTDWLINVGYYEEINGKKVAKTPTTIEEVEEVLRLFTTADPDQNGKNDTYGISPYGETFYLNPLYHAFGVTPDYDLDHNNTPTYMFLQDEFKDFLNWFHKMYQSGYVDPQFATNKNADDRTKFYEGKVGMLITNAEEHITWIGDSFDNANGLDEDGNSKFTLGAAPVGTKNVGKEGAHGFSDWGGWWGGYSISKDCKDPHAALRLLNYLYSPSGNQLRHYGIEGVHYHLEDGQRIIDLEGRNNEPNDTFITNKEASGNAVASGYYKLGSAFCGNIKWEEDNTCHTIVEPEIISYKYASLIQKGIENNTLCSSRLTNVTGFYSSYTTKMKKIQDESSSFAINAIMGNKNLTTDWDEMMQTLNTKTYDWENVQKMIVEVATKAGILS